MKPTRQAGGGRRLRIVQVISNYPYAQPVPSFRGGTEKVVHDVTESLVKRGHDVTLFAALGSRTGARLIAYPRGLKASGIADFVLRRLPPGTDIIHDHTFRSQLGRRKRPVPVVCTIHMPESHRVAYPVYVSQRARQLFGRGRGFYIYNGIDPAAYPLVRRKRGYLLFIGRLVREKGVLQAIEVAERTGSRLLIAGPVKDARFFRNELAPRLASNRHIRYIGEVSGTRKTSVIGHAKCVLFPVQWEEPFGLVMIEAMACGTPVLALRRGSVPEVLAGFPYLICGSVAEMARKALTGRFPPPAALRRYVASRFSRKRMIDRYLAVYRAIIRREGGGGAR